MHHNAIGEHERCCRAQGQQTAWLQQSELWTAQQLLRLLLTLNFSGLELAQISQESYDKSHYALWPTVYNQCFKERCANLSECAERGNKLARSQKQNIQFHHPSALLLSYFQSDCKSVLASPPPFISTRGKNFRYHLYTDTSSSFKIQFSGD